jgi:hypothetical protein
VIDYEVAITKPIMMRDKQCDGRVQMLEFVAMRRVDRNEPVTVQQRAVLDAFGEHLTKSRFPNSERTIEYDNHQPLLPRPVSGFHLRVIWLGRFTTGLSGRPDHRSAV